MGLAGARPQFVVQQLAMNRGILAFEIVDLVFLRFVPARRIGSGKNRTGGVETVRHPCMLFGGNAVIVDPDVAIEMPDKRSDLRHLLYATSIFTTKFILSHTPHDQR